MIVIELSDEDRKLLVRTYQSLAGAILPLFPGSSWLLVEAPAKDGKPGRISVQYPDGTDKTIGRNER